MTALSLLWRSYRRMWLAQRVDCRVRLPRTVVMHLVFWLLFLAIDQGLRNCPGFPKDSFPFRPGGPADFYRCGDKPPTESGFMKVFYSIFTIYIEHIHFNLNYFDASLSKAFWSHYLCAGIGSEVLFPHLIRHVWSIIHVTHNKLKGCRPYSFPSEWMY
jgi:hypothetical protein